MPENRDEKILLKASNKVIDLSGNPVDSTPALFDVEETRHYTITGKSGKGLKLINPHLEIVGGSEN